MRGRKRKGEMVGGQERDCHSRFPSLWQSKGEVSGGIQSSFFIFVTYEECVGEWASLVFVNSKRLVHLSSLDSFTFTLNTHFSI